MSKAGDEFRARRREAHALPTMMAEHFGSAAVPAKAAPRKGAGDPLRLAERQAIELVDQTADDLAELAQVVAERTPLGVTPIQRMRDAVAGQPGAQSYDVIGSGPSAVPWCWEHQREASKCGGLCPGTPIVVSDPTGEAALDPDIAAADLAMLAKDLEDLRKRANRVLRVLSRYGSRVPRFKDRVALKNDNEPRCDSCSKVGKWEPARSVKGIKINGQMMRLCRWCDDWVREVGRPPSRKELRTHHAGHRVFRPKLLPDTDEGEAS